MEITTTEANLLHGIIADRLDAMLWRSQSADLAGDERTARYWQERHSEVHDAFLKLGRLRIAASRHTPTTQVTVKWDGL